MKPREACFPGFRLAKFDALRCATCASALAGWVIAALPFPYGILVRHHSADLRRCRRGGAHLAGVALRTLLVTSPVLDALTGGRIFLKAETLQRTGSFKFRGGYNLSSIPPARRRGVVAFSSGNHAQGVAAAAQLLGMPAVIVMPSDAPRPKRERTEALGAEVVLYDRAREDREAIAREIAERAARAWCRPTTIRWSSPARALSGREIIEDMAAARAHARHRARHRLGRRADRRHRARGQGARAAGAASTQPSREGFDDHARSLPQRPARTNAALPARSATR